jgi:hypothetical protein
MRAYVLMYAAEAYETGESRMKELKETIEKDCSMWINSSAITACASAGSLLAIDLKKTDASDNDYIHSWTLTCFFLFMHLSALFGMTGMILRMCYLSFYNMCPANYVTDARAYSGNRIIEIRNSWSIPALTSWAMAKLNLDDRARLAFFSLVFMFLGIFSALFNQYHIRLELTLDFTATMLALLACIFLGQHVWICGLQFSKEETVNFANKKAIEVWGEEFCRKHNLHASSGQLGMTVPMK